MSTTDLNIYRPEAPLNEAEKNFVSLFGLEIILLRQWLLYVHTPDRRRHVLDRTLSFDTWAKQIKS